MKIKAFSLIEVLTASYIFMIVTMMIVSSFAMIKRSNQRSEDMRLAAGCAITLQNVASSMMKSANFGNPTIMGVSSAVNEATFQLKAVSAHGEYMGYAVFEDPMDGSTSSLKIKALVRRSDKNYYFSSGVISLASAANPGADPRVNIPDNFDISSIVNSADKQRINSKECISDVNFIRPFEINHYDELNGRESVAVYYLTFNDKIHRSINGQQDNYYSQIKLEVSNDSKQF